MSHEDGDFEQRLARFDSVVDRLTLTLHQWRQAQEHAALPDSDVDRRIQSLEQTIEREARALRQLHEAPLKELQAHATNLEQLCVAAAKSVNGLDQAESRLAAMEADLHLHLADLSQNVQALVTDLRAVTSATAPARGAAASWPLDRVVQVHGQLRRGVTGLNDGLPAPGDRSHLDDPSPTASIADAPHERAVGPRPMWRYAVVGLVVAVLVAGSITFARRLDARLTEATARAAAAEQHAAAETQSAIRQIASTREEADRQLVMTRRSAERAEHIGAILAAPDLVRFPLAGTSKQERLAAQVLWSRTRGLVLSASRLPVAPPRTTYQLWLWTNDQPVSAGAFVPDASGAATLVTDSGLNVSGPITNVAVTVEPAGGVAVPSGRTLLARLQ